MIDFAPIVAVTRGCDGVIPHPCAGADPETFHRRAKRRSRETLMAITRCPAAARAENTSNPDVVIGSRQR